MHNLPIFEETGSVVSEWIKIISFAIEVLAVVIIVVAVFYLTISYAFRLVRWRMIEKEGYKKFKANMGRALLLALEILVAADIVRTVALETTLESVVVLGVLVLIRVFLSWSLIVEIEGRWPWQPPSERELEDPLEL